MTSLKLDGSKEHTDLHTDVKPASPTPVPIRNKYREKKDHSRQAAALGVGFGSKNETTTKLRCNHVFVLDLPQIKEKAVLNKKWPAWEEIENNENYCRQQKASKIIDTPLPSRLDSYLAKDIEDRYIEIEPSLNHNFDQNLPMSAQTWDALADHIALYISRDPVNSHKAREASINPSRTLLELWKTLKSSNLSITSHSYNFSINISSSPINNAYLQKSFRVMSDDLSEIFTEYCKESIDEKEAGSFVNVVLWTWELCLTYQKIRSQFLNKKYYAMRIVKNNYLLSSCPVQYLNGLGSGDQLSEQKKTWMFCRFKQFALETIADPPDEENFPLFKNTEEKEYIKSRLLFREDLDKNLFSDFISGPLSSRWFLVFMPLEFSDYESLMAAFLGATQFQDVISCLIHPGHICANSKSDLRATYKKIVKNIKHDA